MITVNLELKSGQPTALVVKGPGIQKIRGIYINYFQRGSKRNTGYLPLTPLALKLIYDVFPQAQVDSAVAIWYDLEMTRRKHLANVYNFHVANNGPLYPFQQRAVEFITTLGGKCLLGDDPRLGKTIQSLTVMARLVQDEPIFVFTLKSLCSYWAGAVKQWTNLNPIILTGPAHDRAVGIMTAQAGNVYITNWETLRLVTDKVLKRVKHVIGDECHVVRQRKAQVTNAFTKLRPEHCILASATMIEQGPQDYFTLLKVLRPKEFSSYWRFVGWYCKTEFNGFGNTIVDSQNEDLLADHLATLALRRKAHEVIKDLPQKIYQDIRVEPTKELMAEYQKIAHEVYVQIQGRDDLIIPNELARMVRLKQVSITPKVLGFNFESPKLTAIQEYITTLPADWQIVIYTSFRESASALAKLLNGHLYIGGVNDAKPFETGKKRILVTTPQIGGVGKDYSNATVIMYADLPLSATLLRQSIERTTKIGLTEPRLIVTFSCTPIDYAMAETLRVKQDRIKDSDIFEAILRYLV